jgi:hypothetical protein
MALKPLWHTLRFSRLFNATLGRYQWAWRISVETLSGPRRRQQILLIDFSNG